MISTSASRCASESDQKGIFEVKVGGIQATDLTLEKNGIKIIASGLRV